jgi:hypothetical protein
MTQTALLIDSVEKLRELQPGMQLRQTYLAPPRAPILARFDEYVEHALLFTVISDPACATRAGVAYRIRLFQHEVVKPCENGFQLGGLIRFEFVSADKKPEETEEATENPSLVLADQLEKFRQELEQRIALLCRDQSINRHAEGKLRELVYQLDPFVLELRTAATQTTKT